MSLIPGSLPSDTCYGTPQELLELFAQYLDIPAFAVSSKVLYSAVDPSPNTDFLWVNTLVPSSPVLSVYNNGAYREYPFEGSLSPARPETLISGKSSISILAGSDRFLVSQAGTSNVLKKITWTNLTGQIPSGTITYPMLSTSATEASNVAKRVAKAFCVAQNNGTLQSGSFGFSSVTDGGTGLLQINFNFTASTNAVAVATNHANGAMGGIERTGLTTGSVTFQSRNSGGSAQDCNISCIVFSE